MNYFFDTEFIEGFHKPLFGKRRHFIDLISIGIVCEDGRSYYAISNEFNTSDADDWVRDNVIAQLPSKHKGNGRLWKSNDQIRDEITAFFGYKPAFTDEGSMLIGTDSDIAVYAYYADYDWVLFCSLFGRMIDLPPGFPMYCRDLKQMFDTAFAGQDHEQVKSSPDYPTQDSEHDALDDAKWNQRLYAFIRSHIE